MMLKYKLQNINIYCVGILTIFIVFFFNILFTIQILLREYCILIECENLSKLAIKHFTITIFVNN